MLQPLLIALVAIIYVHDAQGSMLDPSHLGPARIIACILGAQALIALLTHLCVAACGRALDRTGAPRFIYRAESILSTSRFLAVGVQVAAVFVFGWLDIVRASVGDLILIDEILATLPPLLVFVAGWWSFYPIERRLHEAALLRTLDRGGAVYPTPTRWQFVLDKVRHQALLVLVPISLVMAWAETLGWFFLRYADRIPIMHDERYAAPIYSGVQLLGVGLIFLFSPPIMRLVWSTIPLSPGPLRDRLVALCASHGVKIRRMLVWRTHGMMINGAVMGLLGRLRYILLTDALLDSLPPDQIEAVMAHEVGHVRRHHLPWLAAAMLASLGLGALAVALPITFAARLLAFNIGAIFANILDAASTIGAFAIGLVVFGFVSRRFERQADAFAVQHLSGMTKANRGRNLAITREAADSMAGALQSVAVLNHIPRHKFTWRHGSIANRQRAIESLVGRQVDALPIDCASRRIKLAALAALALFAALATVDTIYSLSPEPEPQQSAQHSHATTHSPITLPRY